MKNRVPLYFKILVITSIALFVAAIVTLISRINTLDPESEQIKELYSYLGNNYLDYCKGLPFYESETVDTKSMDESLKMCLAYKMVDYKNIESETLKKEKKEDACNLTKEKKFRLDKEDDVCSVKVLDVSDLNSAYFTLFGESIKDWEDFNLSGTKTCYYDEEESRYVCGDTIIQNLQLDWVPTTFRTISKVKEKGDKIYLYDYYIAINNKKCYTTNNGDFENTKCSDNINTNTEYNSKFVFKYGQKYLHIFKKDANGNYHWYSSSIVK